MTQAVSGNVSVKVLDEGQRYPVDRFVVGRAFSARFTPCPNGRWCAKVRLIGKGSAHFVVTNPPRSLSEEGEVLPFVIEGDIMVGKRLLAGSDLFFDAALI